MGRRYGRSVGYYNLTRWKYYDKFYGILSEIEEKNARCFFLALERLTEDEREILKRKFYLSDLYAKYSKHDHGYKTVRPIPDQQLAMQQGVSLYRFTNARKAAESKLDKELGKIRNYQLETYIMRVNSAIYFVELIGDAEVFDLRQYIVGDFFSAKIFHYPEDEHLAYELMELGFEKVPPHAFL